MSRWQDLIAIERASTTADGSGGRSVEWAEVYSLWAEVKPVRGRETEIRGRLATTETYLVKIRRGPSITAKDRIIWRGKELNIRSGPQDREMTRRFLWLECEYGT